MKKIFLIALACSLSSFAFAADTAMQGKMDPATAQMMKDFKEASTPGAQHEILKNMAGSWKYTSKMWQGEGAKAEETTGTSKLKMVLGGRFLMNETKSKVMGMPFEGIGMTGYNNVTKEYETSWYDNMSTGMMHGTGSFDNTTQTLVDNGEFTCPIQKKSVKYRAEWKIIDKDNMTYTMWSPDPKTGKEFKGMEMLMKRVKTSVANR